MSNDNNTTQSKVIEQKNSGKIDKFVNMAFTDENYEFIVSEASKLNAHFTNFINLAISSTSDNEIENFLAKNPIRQCKSLASKRTGKHLKRIYFKLSPQNFEKICTCSEQNDSSKTIIVNIMLEIYRRKQHQEQ